MCRAVPCRAVPCRAVPCRAVPCRAVPCRAVPCRAVPCRAVPCRAVPCRAVPCRAVPCRAVPCRVVSCRVVSCRVVSCRAVPCRAVPCRAVPCRAVPCRAVPCRAAPRKTRSIVTFFFPQLFATTPGQVLVFRILSTLGRNHVTIRDGSEATSPVLLDGDHNANYRSVTNPCVTVRTTQEKISIHVRAMYGYVSHYVQMELLSVIPGLITTFLSLRA